MFGPAVLVVAMLCSFSPPEGELSDAPPIPSMDAAQTPRSQDAEPNTAAAGPEVPAQLRYPDPGPATPHGRGLVVGGGIVLGVVGGAPMLLGVIGLVTGGVGTEPNGRGAIGGLGSGAVFLMGLGVVGIAGGAVMMGIGVRRQKARQLWRVQKKRWLLQPTAQIDPRHGATFGVAARF